MKSKWLLVVLGFIFIGLIVLNYFISGPKEYDVRVVTPPAIIASLPHWVAEERGYYKDAHLRVITIDITASNLMVQALLDGDADVLPAVSLVDIANVSAQIPIKPLIFSHSRMRCDPPFEALSVVQASLITTLKELEGKSIAVYPGVTSKAAVSHFLKKNNVRTDTIEFIPLPPPEHITALQRGDVAASHIYEPQKTANLQDGKTRLISESIYAYFNSESAIGVSALSTKFYNTKKDAAKQYLSVWDRAVDYIRTHDKDAREILMNHLKLSREVAMKATWVDVTKTYETSSKNVIETAKTFQEMGVISEDIILDETFFIPK